MLIPAGYALALAVAFLVFEGGVQYYESRAGARVELAIRPGVAILYTAAGLYGIHRARLFHPFFDHEYQDWLERTPWTVARPLPLGPIQLTWKDGVVLGALILLDRVLPEHESIRILCVFLFCHVFTLLTAVALTGSSATIYLTWFLLGLVVLLWPRPWACAVSGAAAYLVVYEGVWGSLRNFPWERSFTPSRLSDQALRDGKDRPKPSGWPYDRLLCDPVEPSPVPSHWLDAVIWSLLCGWWAFCLLSQVTNPRILDAIRGPGFANTVNLAILWRVLAYQRGYSSPISLAGRIATGRWIVPGYDVIYLAPILILFAFPAVLLTLRAWDAPSELGLPVCLAVAIFIALTTPPERRQWRLTGRHRMTSGLSKSNEEFVKVS
jgi:hypothetical protein